MTERRTPELPDRRRNPFEAYTTAVEQRLHRFFVKALFIFAIIGITSAVALFGFGLVLAKIKDTRQDFVRDTCKATNERNEDATNFIIDVANEQILEAKSAAQRDAIDKSLRQWIKLINLQAPKQNCDQLAKVSTGDAEPPPPVPSPTKESP